MMYQSLIELISDPEKILKDSFLNRYQSLIELISDVAGEVRINVLPSYQSLIELISDRVTTHILCRIV